MMDYSMFEILKEQDAVTEESEQEKMERFFRSFCADFSDQQNRINERMRPAYDSCDATARKLTLRYLPELWQANPSSFLHGGMIATAVDITAGLLVKYLAKSNEVVTVEMNCNYLRPIPIDSLYRVTAQAVKTGRTMYFVNVVVAFLEPEKPMATATLVYMDISNQRFG